MDLQSLKVRGPFWSLDFQILLVLGPLQKLLLPLTFRSNVPFHSILGPKYCGWTPDAFLCDWIQNSPTLTFSDINKSVLVGITSDFSSCYRNSKNTTKSYFNFHPLNSVRTMKWIARTIRSGEVCK